MERRAPLFISAVAFLIFLLFQTTGISGGDSGDLVTAAYLGGVAHPPGYPLYTAFGFLLSKLPLFTVAWRITLLSSIFHAATLGFVFSMVRGITRSWIASIFSTVLLFANYNFFHYSVTPEVFSLLDAFVAAILYGVVCLEKRFTTVGLVTLSFIVGLSLSHHHVILFLAPAIFYWAFFHRKKILGYGRGWMALLFFALGLLPYLYIPVAARSGAIINWDRAVDVSHFVRLITRRDYGTFISGGAFAPELLPRLIAVKAYAQFFLLDFRLAPLVLSLLGFVALWLTHRRFAVMFLLAFLFLGPGFFFYASFPLSGRFSLGTYERFLLPTYVLTSVFFGVGVKRVSDMMKNRVLYGATLITLFVILGLSVASTVWRFWGIQKDQTAEFLGMDIVSSVPKDAVILLAYDTPLFTTQYVRYVQGVRPDVRVIHASRLSSPDYQQVLYERFPELTIPESGAGFAGAFAASNIEKFPVFTNVPFPVGSTWYWVPYGLLYQLVEEDNLPTVGKMYETNRALWSAFHDPRSGILSRYPHLMLSDVLGSYAAGHIALGKALLRAGEVPKAWEEFGKAVSLGSDSHAVDALLLRGVAESYMKQCEQATTSFEEAGRVAEIPDERIPLFTSITLRECAGDAEKADELFSQYEAMTKVLDIPLDQL